MSEAQKKRASRLREQLERATREDAPSDLPLTPRQFTDQAAERARVEANEHIVRFRADPTEIRVSVRKCPNVDCEGWSATVSRRDHDVDVDDDHNTVVAVCSRYPMEAVLSAVEAAQKTGMSGIDLGMDWAYPHPQGDSSRARER